MLPCKGLYFSFKDQKLQLLPIESEYDTINGNKKFFRFLVIHWRSFGTGLHTFVKSRIKIINVINTFIIFVQNLTNMKNAGFIPDLVVASPGRINLIGEHTDYNNGFVLPTAINKYIVFKFKINGTPSQCHITSKDFLKSMTIDLNQLVKSEVVWENFMIGVLYHLKQHTDGIKGFDCEIESGLPMGSGVSSSAALECGLAYGVNALFQLGLNKSIFIKVGQKAEHDFVGTKCGIMDQFASVMSQKNKAILLDCKSLEYNYIPLELGEYNILLLNTNVSHSLADSQYNLRREACESAVATINKEYPQVNSLRDVDIALLEACSPKLTPIQRKRCSYVLAENQRVQQAVDALQQAKLDEFGKLMYASHRGLSEEYEVSCKELDFLVEFSKAHDGVLGSRMMGGGFGGCTINIIHKDAIPTYVDQVGKAYQQEFNINLDYFEALPSEGTHILKD